MLTPLPPTSRKSLFESWRAANHVPLHPKLKIVVGAGFVREEVKAVFLSPSQMGLPGMPGLGLSSTTVVDIEELTLSLLKGLMPGTGWKFLTRTERLEWLRALFSEHQTNLPLLFAQAHRSTFSRNLDRALQSGRLAFAHEAELQVFQDRLKSQDLSSPLRAELIVFSHLWEKSLMSAEALDLPLALSLCSERLSELLEKTQPDILARYLNLPPQGIHYLCSKNPESREQLFWDQLSKLIQVHQVKPESFVEAGGGTNALASSQDPHPGAPSRWTWEVWHTLDDAAERLADSVSEARLESESLRSTSDGSHEGGAPLSEFSLLIPDRAENRRAVFEALHRQGHGLADPREPSALQLEEKWKRVWLPIQVIAGDFERDDVEDYLAVTPEVRAELSARMAEAGVKSGLASYQGLNLKEVYRQLEALQKIFPSRLTLSELSQAHLLWIQSREPSLPSEVFSFVSQFWTSWLDELLRLSRLQDAPAPLGRLLSRKLRIRAWWEKIQDRFALQPPPVLKLKPLHGVRLYGTHQVPLAPTPRLWMIAMSSQTLSEERIGDWFFSERDRDTLSQEFSVRTSRQARLEKRAILRAWWQGAEKGVLLSHRYHWDGKEREDLSLLISELSDGSEFTPLQRGAHRRWLESFQKSFTPKEWISSQEVVLPLALQDSTGIATSVPIELTASLLDSYTKCPFITLVQYRWGLQDLREPEHELWGDVRGNLVHAAAQKILQSQFKLSVEDALESAWALSKAKGRLRGLFPGRRVERLAKRGLIKILYRWVEKEKETFAKSGARTIVLDDRLLTYRGQGYQIIGKPDRIDLNEKGAWIIDYKTSSSLPTGRDMVEKGARLQLPFYALAYRQEESSHAVCGVQFVVMKLSADRGKGIFFQETNGDAPGSYTQVTSRSASLMKDEPEVVWEKLETKLDQAVKGVLAGQHAPRPVLGEKECLVCRFSLVCGKKRREASQSSETGSSLSPLEAVSAGGSDGS
jgi:RecB family exonuclease